PLERVVGELERRGAGALVNEGLHAPHVRRECFDLVALGREQRTCLDEQGVRFFEVPRPSGEAAELAGRISDLERVAGNAAELEAAAEQRFCLLQPSLIGAYARHVDSSDR